LLIIFDLDGTLIDSSKDLAIAMNATRLHVGMEPLDPNLIFSYVGNGVPMLVRRALGPEAPEELVQQAVIFFLKFYRVHAIEHTQLYPDIRELLEELSRAEHKLAILTNKPARISFDILDALKLASHFVRVFGGDSLAAKKPDPLGITTLLTETGFSAQNALMVGDSGVDVQTARNAGVRSCGVTWGFQPESLRSNPPDILLNAPLELLTYI
jgi:phosphoglycolate phosphatase